VNDNHIRLNFTGARRTCVRPGIMQVCMYLPGENQSDGQTDRDAHLKTRGRGGRARTVSVNIRNTADLITRWIAIPLIKRRDVIARFSIACRGVYTI